MHVAQVTLRSAKTSNRLYREYVSYQDQKLSPSEEDVDDTRMKTWGSCSNDFVSGRLSTCVFATSSEEEYGPRYTSVCTREPKSVL